MKWTYREGVKIFEMPELKAIKEAAITFGRKLDFSSVENFQSSASKLLYSSSVLDKVSYEECRKLNAVWNIQKNLCCDDDGFRRLKRVYEICSERARSDVVNTEEKGQKQTNKTENKPKETLKATQGETASSSKKKQKSLWRRAKAKIAGVQSKINNSKVGKWVGEIGNLKVVRFGGKILGPLGIAVGGYETVSHDKKAKQFENEAKTGQDGVLDAYAAAQAEYEKSQRNINAIGTTSSVLSVTPLAAAGIVGELASAAASGYADHIMAPQKER